MNQLLEADFLFLKCFSDKLCVGKWRVDSRWRWGQGPASGAVSVGWVILRVLPQLVACARRWVVWWQWRWGRTWSTAEKRLGQLAVWRIPVSSVITTASFFELVVTLVNLSRDSFTCISKEDNIGNSDGSNNVRCSKPKLGVRVRLPKDERVQCQFDVRSTVGRGVLLKRGETR